MSDPEIPDAEAQRRKVMRQRNLVLALTLGAFVVLFFAITVVKFQH